MDDNEVESPLESPHKGKTGLRRVFNAFFYSLEGLRSAWKHEDAFRQELIFALLLIPAALWLGQTGLERAVLIASLFGVVLMELLNSAVEATVDRISLENHRLAKRAKDIGSAAVLIAILNVIVVWGLILI